MPCRRCTYTRPGGEIDACQLQRPGEGSGLNDARLYLLPPLICTESEENTSQYIRSRQLLSSPVIVVCRRSAVSAWALPSELKEEGLKTKLDKLSMVCRQTVDDPSTPELTIRPSTPKLTIPPPEP